MKVALLALLFVAPAFAQAPPTASTTACGPENSNFNVKPDDSQHSLAQPEPGKALVYFIQEKAADSFGVTTQIGLDGTWVGANKNSSYFAVSVDPGEHHVCANVQSFRGHRMGLVHFTAQVGMVYYFDARIVYGEQAEPILFLGAVDSDQAKYLIATTPMSVSNPKK